MAPAVCSSQVRSSQVRSWHRRRMRGRARPRRSSSRFNTNGVVTATLNGIAARHDERAADRDPGRLLLGAAERPRRVHQSAAVRAQRPRGEHPGRHARRGGRHALASDVLPAELDLHVAHRSLPIDRLHVPDVVQTSSGRRRPHRLVGAVDPRAARSRPRKDVVGSALAPFRGKLAGIVTASRASLRLAYKGKGVASLKPGRYTISVIDESTSSGFAVKGKHGT